MDDNENNNQIEPIMFNVDQAAQFLNVPKFTLYRLLTARGFPAVKWGREWRIHREKLAKWAEMQCRKPF